MMKQQLVKKKRRDKEMTDANPSSQKAPVAVDLQACIAQRAYELFEQEGCCHGNDLDQWLQAEQDILSTEPRR